MISGVPQVLDVTNLPATPYVPKWRNLADALDSGSSGSNTVGFESPLRHQSFYWTYRKSEGLQFPALVSWC